MKNTFTALFTALVYLSFSQNGSSLIEENIEPVDPEYATFLEERKTTVYPMYTEGTPTKLEDLMYAYHSRIDHVHSSEFLLVVTVDTVGRSRYSFDVKSEEPLDTLAIVELLSDYSWRVMKIRGVSIHYSKSFYFNFKREVVGLSFIYQFGKPLEFIDGDSVFFAENLIFIENKLTKDPNGFYDVVYIRKSYNDETFDEVIYNKVGDLDFLKSKDNLEERSEKWVQEHAVFLEERKTTVYPVYSKGTPKDLDDLIYSYHSNLNHSHSASFSIVATVDTLGQPSFEFDVKHSDSVDVFAINDLLSTSSWDVIKHQGAVINYSKAFHFSFKKEVVDLVFKYAEGKPLRYISGNERFYRKNLSFIANRLTKKSNGLYDIVYSKCFYNDKVSHEVIYNRDGDMFGKRKY